MDTTKEKQKNTHFGYETIPAEEKNDRVAGVFHSVAKQYDLMNDLMSFGIHRIWKKRTLHLSHVKTGHKVLDIAGGTGDLALGFSKRVGDSGQVILSDINFSMLQEGKRRLTDLGYRNNTDIIQADAQNLPFPDNSFHCISIGFGLRNVTDKQQALQSMYRCIKPGGKLLILEFSKPTLPGLNPIYDAYSFIALPMLGKVIAKDSDSYRYLAESIRKHPGQDELKLMMERAGWENCDYQNFSGGIVALHWGYKL